MPSQAAIDLFIRQSMTNAALLIIKDIEGTLFKHIQSPSRASTLNSLLASEALQRTLVVSRHAEMLCAMLAAQRAAMQKVLAEGNISPDYKELLMHDWESEKSKKVKAKEAEGELTTILWLWGARMARIWEREVAKALGLPARQVLWGYDERLTTAEPNKKIAGTSKNNFETGGKQLKRGEPAAPGGKNEGYTNAEENPKRKSILKPPRKYVKFVDGY